jgi:hypothetical protein
MVIYLKKIKPRVKLFHYLPEIVIGWFAQKSLKDKLLPAGHNDPLLKAFLPSLPFSKRSFINRFYIVVDMFTINPAQFKYKRIPKLIIESDNDPLVPEKLRNELKELYPEAKVHTFHNEGHFPYINATKEFNETLNIFFNEKNDIKEVEKVVYNYFKGRKNANIGLLKRIFNDKAQLNFSDNINFHFISLENYLSKVKQDGVKQVNTKILDIDIQNNMAFVKTAFKYTKESYVDYLILLKKNDNWEITSKTFIRNDIK